MDGHKLLMVYHSLEGIVVIKVIYAIIVVTFKQDAHQSRCTVLYFQLFENELAWYFINGFMSPVVIKVIY